MTEPDLTRFELFSLAAKFEEVSLISAGLFLTVISGFLVMSYAIGANLTRRQCWMVVPVFVLAASMTLLNWTLLGAFATQFFPRNYYKIDQSEFSIATLLLSGDFAFGHLMTLVVGAMIIGGALIFLRDIRKNAAKAEAAALESEAEAEAASRPEQVRVEAEVIEPEDETSQPEAEESPDLAQNTAEKDT